MATKTSKTRASGARQAPEAVNRSIRAEIGGYADDSAPRRREEEVLM
jgi:hypothetical protein